MRWPPRVFRTSSADAEAYRLYLHAVEQARQPAFYERLGVPDTVDGRFDLVILHVVLILRRLKRDRERGTALGQALFDLMFADFDQNLREMGVGDIGVGKRIKAMAQAFYGRLAAYDAALDAENDEQLMDALKRNLYRKAEPSDGNLKIVSAYVRKEAAALDRRPVEHLVDGTFTFGEVPTL